MQLIFWLIAIILSFGAGISVFFTDKKRAVPYPLLTSLLRGLVVFFTLLLILVPAMNITKNTTEKPIVLLLQDNSSSIANALGTDSTAYRKNIETLGSQLSTNYNVVKWGFGNSIQTDSIFDYKQQSTDIASAIANAQEFYGQQNLGAIILASDGRFNQGSNPLYQQNATHCPIYAIAIGDSAVQKDIRIAQTHANKIVTLNSNFEIRLDIVANICKGYNNSLSIKEEGKTLSTVPLIINNDKFDHSYSFTIKADKPGIHHYTLSVPPYEGEKVVANNQKDLFIEVIEEKKNILIVSASPHPDVNAIKDALVGLETYKVSVTSADNMPSSLSGYNAIILHGLPSLRNNCTAQLLAAKKPVWFILTSQTNNQTINDLHNLTHTTISPAPTHNITALYNPAFNAFTLPQQIQTVFDKMPPLSANVGNILAAPGTLALFDQMTITGDGKTPVWVLEQGETPTAFLLGEGIWRWRIYEFKNFGNHNVVDECIQQTVAFLCANTKEKPFTVTLQKNIWSDQEPVWVKATLLNNNLEPMQAKGNLSVLRSQEMVIA